MGRNFANTPKIVFVRDLAAAFLGQNEQVMVHAELALIHDLDLLAELMWGNEGR